MASGCTLLCLEDFVLRILSERTEIRDKYERLIFKDCVESHPQLRFCPGIDCHVVIKAQCQKAKKVTCTSCRISFWYVPSLLLQNLTVHSVVLQVVTSLDKTCACWSFPEMRSSFCWLTIQAVRIKIRVLR